MDQTDVLSLGLEGYRTAETSWVANKGIIGNSLVISDRETDYKRGLTSGAAN